MFRREVTSLKMGRSIYFKRAARLIRGIDTDSDLIEDVALQVLLVMFSILAAPGLFLHPLDGTPSLPIFAFFDYIVGGGFLCTAHI